MDTLSQHELGMGDMQFLNELGAWVLGHNGPATGFGVHSRQTIGRTASTPGGSTQTRSGRAGANPGSARRVRKRPAKTVDDRNT